MTSSSVNISQVGDQIAAPNAGWSFAGEVANHFDAHVSKSVPFYEEGHQLVAKLSDFFLSEGSICYELGCSTGTLSHKIATWNDHKSIEMIGVDIEKDMIRVATEKYRNTGIHFYAADVADMDLKKCDMIVCYYTLQFVKPKMRQVILDKCYEALNWGGALVVFEKVRACDARFQDIMSGLYMDYKLDQGYSTTEIIAKSRSLKGVLEPFSTQGNIDLMKRAGFTDIISVMKYICFEGFLAIK
jgi:tRNA (cmo5U34)-methyltransferase